MILTFGGGTNEPQRDLIAVFGSACRSTPRSLDGLLLHPRAAGPPALPADPRSRVTPERFKEIEAGEDNFDRSCGRTRDAGLLGISVPEAHGGGGSGRSRRR